jgi:hypothetical protein
MSASADFLAPSALSMAGKNILFNIPSNCGSTESDIPVTVVFMVYGRWSIVDASLQTVQIPEIPSVKGCTYNEGFPAGSPSIWDSSKFDIILHSCKRRVENSCDQNVAFNVYLLIKFLCLCELGCEAVLGVVSLPKIKSQQTKHGGERSQNMPNSWTLGFRGECHD